MRVDFVDDFIVRKIPTKYNNAVKNIISFETLENVQFKLKKIFDI